MVSVQLFLVASSSAPMIAGLIASPRMWMNMMLRLQASGERRKGTAQITAELIGLAVAKRMNSAMTKMQKK